MLVDNGAKDAADEVIAVAETLGAGVAKALLGKAVLPDDLPYVTGAIGPLGTRPSWELMTHCDNVSEHRQEVRIVSRSERACDEVLGARQ